MYRLLLTFCFAITSIFGFAQNENEPANVTFLGIDYSHIKLIGQMAQFNSAGEVDGNQIIDNYFPAWNQFFINEQKKYDMAKALNQKNVIYDIVFFAKKNKATDPKTLFTENNPNYTDAEIEKFVKTNNYTAQTKYVAYFLAESYNKGLEEAMYRFVVVETKSKKIVANKIYTSKPGGFGIKNYWASTYYKILKKLPKDSKNWFQ